MCSKKCTFSWAIHWYIQGPGMFETLTSVLCSWDLGPVALPPNCIKLTAVESATSAHQSCQLR